MKPDDQPDLAGEKEQPINPPAADPFTGTRPVGPLQPGPGDRGNWPLAARWLIAGIVLLLVFIVLTWLF